jgi:hypothetical protein
MRPLTSLVGKPYIMTPVIYTAGLGLGGRCYLSSKRKLRLGVYFCSGSLTWFRRPRLASFTPTTNVETNHPLVLFTTTLAEVPFYR